MYGYIDTACRIYEDTDRQERNMFQLSCVPQPMEHWQDYIDLVTKTHFWCFFITMSRPSTARWTPL